MGHVLKRFVESMFLREGGSNKMLINQFECNYPCDDIKKEMIYPVVDLNPESINVIMVSECPPLKKDDYFYKNSSGSFFQTTKIAFQDAGVAIDDYGDLTKRGFYLTTAIKCRKQQYLVSSKTIKECAFKFLKTELEQFPNVKAIMCMGDFAIKAINYIFKAEHHIRAIKAGSTYKIRHETHMVNDIRFFPSYTQTGDSFDIEKSKRKMIAEDIKSALAYVKKC